MKPITRGKLNAIKLKVVELMSLTDRIDLNDCTNPEGERLAVREMIEATGWLNNYLKELYNSKTKYG